MQINDYDATKSITTDATESSPGSDTLGATTSSTTSDVATSTNVPTNYDVVATLNGLIETCKDGQDGFQTAADGVQDSSLKSVFHEYAQQRAQFAGELQSLVKELDGDPETSGSISAALHRGWINIKSVVTGKDDHAILSECERGEDIAKKAYQNAVGTNLPSNVATVIQTQFDAVKQAHDKIRDLRDSGTYSASASA